MELILHNDRASNSHHHFFVYGGVVSNYIVKLVSLVWLYFLIVILRKKKLNPSKIRYNSMKKKNDWQQLVELEINNFFTKMVLIRKLYILLFC